MFKKLRPQTREEGWKAEETKKAHDCFPFILEWIWDILFCSHPLLLLFTPIESWTTRLPPASFMFFLQTQRKKEGKKPTLSVHGLSHVREWKTEDQSWKVTRSQSGKKSRTEEEKVVGKDEICEKRVSVILVHFHSRVAVSAQTSVWGPSSSHYYDFLHHGSFSSHHNLSSSYLQRVSFVFATFNFRRKDFPTNEPSLKTKRSVSFPSLMFFFLTHTHLSTFPVNPKAVWRQGSLPFFRPSHYDRNGKESIRQTLTTIGHVSTQNREQRIDFDGT